MGLLFHDSELQKTSSFFPGCEGSSLAWQELLLESEDRVRTL